MNELEVLKNSLNISIWMLCVTLFVAVSTVTIGAINMAFQRSHNRKSVKPLCNIHKIFNWEVVNLSIMNAGLGPMIIQKIVLLENGDDDVKKGRNLSDLMPPDLNYDVIVNKNDSYIIPTMGERTIFQYTANSKTKKGTVELLKSTLEGFYICVVYNDIYDHVREKRELVKF